MTRKQAALEIFELQKTMDYKPVALSTVYRRLVKLLNGNWHYCGAGYDYTA